MTENRFGRGTIERRLAVRAAVLSLLAPGLGHLYVRAWVRGALWVGGSTAMFVGIAPEAVIGAVLSGSTDALLAVAGEQSILVAFGIVAVTVRLAGAMDAWRTVHRTARSDATTRCERCGRSVDADLEFCHWCLDGDE